MQRKTLPMILWHQLCTKTAMGKPQTRLPLDPMIMPAAYSCFTQWRSSPLLCDRLFWHVLTKHRPDMTTLLEFPSQTTLDYPSFLATRRNKMSSSNVQSSLSSELGGRLPHSPATNHKIGYADVARWMALDIDSEGHVYRKFDELAARNLLYYQSELFNLMAQLDDLDKKDADSDNMDLRDAARTWETLESRLASNDDEAKSRMDLILSVREKIREYRKYQQASAIPAFNVLTACQMKHYSFTVKSRNCGGLVGGS